MTNSLGNHEHDWRNKIYAFYHHDIPCLNSIDSYVWSVEKAAHYAKLKRVQKKDPEFPLIPQIYYSHPSTGRYLKRLQSISIYCNTNVTSFPPDLPCVLKVGSSSQVSILNLCNLRSRLLLLGSWKK